MAVLISKFSRNGFSIIKMYHYNYNSLHIFFTRMYVFPGLSGLSYNNIITFQYVLSSTSLNSWICVLMEISYHTDNPSNVIRILTPSMILRSSSRIRGENPLLVTFGWMSISEVYLIRQSTS